MRSALDYVAYELARHHHVGEMDDPEEEAATWFPILGMKLDSRVSLWTGRKGKIRSELYSEVEREALQCVQPFALTDEARALGVEPPTDPQDDLLTDHAYALNAVWNVDKHRRLPELAWQLNPVWWSADDGEPAYRWVGHVREPRFTSRTALC